MRAAFEAAVKQYESLGAEIEEVSLPHAEYGVATYYSCGHGRGQCEPRTVRRHTLLRPRRGRRSVCALLQHGAGFGEEVKRRIILGTYVLGGGY